MVDCRWQTRQTSFNLRGKSVTFSPDGGLLAAGTSRGIFNFGHYPMSRHRHAFSEFLENRHHWKPSLPEHPPSPRLPRPAALHPSPAPPPPWRASVPGRPRAAIQRAVPNTPLGEAIALDAHPPAQRLYAMSERIVIDPEVCGGRPIVAGTRMRVTDVLDAWRPAPGSTSLSPTFLTFARRHSRLSRLRRPRARSPGGERGLMRCLIDAQLRPACAAGSASRASRPAMSPMCSAARHPTPHSSPCEGRGSGTNYQGRRFQAALRRATIAWSGCAAATSPTVRCASGWISAGPKCEQARRWPSCGSAVTVTCRGSPIPSPAQTRWATPPRPATLPQNRALAQVSAHADLHLQHPRHRPRCDPSAGNRRRRMGAALAAGPGFGRRGLAGEFGDLWPRAVPRPARRRVRLEPHPGHGRHFRFRIHRVSAVGRARQDRRWLQRPGDRDCRNIAHHGFDRRLFAGRRPLRRLAGAMGGLGRRRHHDLADRLDRRDQRRVRQRPLAWPPRSS